MEIALRHAVQDSLQSYMHDNAIFLAERLWYEFRSLENLHLLAHCHVSSGDHETAFRLLSALYNALQDIPATTADPSPPPSRAPRGTLRPGIAKGTPLWDCLFTFAVAAIHTQRYLEAETALRLLGPEINGSVSYWLGVVTRRLNRQHANPSFGNPAAALFVQAAQLNPMLFTAFQSAARFYTAGEGIYDRALEQSHANPAVRPPTPPAAFTDVAPHQSQAGRPSSAASGATAPPLRARPTSPHNKPNHAAREDAAAGRREVLGMLRHFAHAFYLVYTYQCTKAIEHIEAMPQSNCGWVREHLALAHFHNGDLPHAAEEFDAMTNAEPWRIDLESLVVYSTALWHLKMEVKLGCLAQKMIQAFPKSAYTLCVVGNCHSLSKDAESALLMFTRAARVAPPDFAYVHTLRGHEALALEQETVADSAFRAAMAIDSRHYSACAGLGDLYLRVDDVVRARRQLRLALEVNQLPTVMNRYAATFHRPGAAVSEADLREALRLYDQALALHPRNFAAVHQRATVKLRLGYVDEAKNELERLLVDCGEEAAVHLTLGHCCAQQGDVIRAVASYRRAIDLDPRRTAFASGCIERLAAPAGQSSHPQRLGGAA